jgi:hypothetical protein
MLLDGKIAVPLHASPFVSSPWWRSGTFYVPVKPVLDVVGGKYKVSKSAHRLHVDVPMAEPVAPPKANQ